MMQIAVRVDPAMDAALEELARELASAPGMRPKKSDAARVALTAGLRALGKLPPEDEEKAS